MDDSAANALLDNTFGATHGPASPTSFLVACFDGDPYAGGTELTTVPGGYVRVAIAHADFAAAADRKKTVSVQWPAATVDWPATVTHLALLDNTGATIWAVNILTQPLSVVVGPGPLVPLVIPVIPVGA